MSPYMRIEAKNSVSNSDPENEEEKVEQRTLNSIDKTINIMKLESEPNLESENN